MNFNGWANYEDLFRACGYSSPCDENGDNCNKNENNNSNNSNYRSNYYGCNDIPNGFQTLHPELFIIIGEILGNIVAGSVPFNVQNAIGNWLQLVGQAILTYNAQQQYFQAGPGRYYDIANFNIVNPFCSSESPSTAAYTANTANAQGPSNGSSSRSSSSQGSSRNSNSKGNSNKIETLEKQFNEL
ncbi:MAG: hypothetical protein HUJ77_10650, partial [Clostridium sp.]|uniref:hypothetical protein n=1 Tax=Clostridium sp. TaxID=1506 RepID=UPI0025BCCEE3